MLLNVLNGLVINGVMILVVIFEGGLVIDYGFDERLLFYVILDSVIFCVTLDINGSIFLNVYENGYEI